MRVKYTVAELALRRELKTQLQDSTKSEAERGSFRTRLKRIREDAVKRSEGREIARAQNAADAIAAKREDFASEDEFIEAMDLHHLRLDEAACHRALNSAKTSIRDRALARKRLQEIGLHRLEQGTSAEGESSPLETEANSPSEANSASVLLPDITRLSDIELREAFSKAKWMSDVFGRNNDELLATQEAEIRRRKMPLYWSVEGTGF